MSKKQASELIEYVDDDEFMLEPKPKARRANPKKEETYPILALATLASIFIFTYRHLQKKWPWESLNLGKNLGRRRLPVMGRPAPKVLPSAIQVASNRGSRSDGLGIGRPSYSFPTQRDGIIVCNIT